MSTSLKTKFNSPFIWNTFESTNTESNKSIYQQRIIQIYSDKYPVLNDFPKEQIYGILEARKLKQFELLKNEKQEKEEKEEKEKKEQENGKDDDNENKDDGDKKKEDDAPKKEEDKKEDENKDNKKEDETANNTINCEIELTQQQKKLIYALELLENDYYGNEHDLYLFLCQKYNVKIKEEYNDKSGKSVTEKLLEDGLNIKCSECDDIKDLSEFSKSELQNGYFAACKQCEPDRDNVVTLKWSPHNKSNDVQLKDNNFVAMVQRDSHRFACVDMNNPIKYGCHCFRWYIKGQRSWLLFGISHPKRHRDGSYSEQGVYGIASPGSSYKNGQTKHDLAAHQMYDKSEILVDMKLDLRKSELLYMVVGDPQKRIVKMTGIEQNKDKGYVPHINIYYQGVSVQIKKIPPPWFGKNPKRCKFKY